MGATAASTAPPAAAAGTGSDGAPSEDTFPRQHARTRRLTLGEPRTITVSPDGRRVVFIRSRGGSDPIGCLWVLDVAVADDEPAGGERLVADPLVLLAGGDDDLPAAERARRERAREQAGGVVSYAANATVTVAAFALSGRLFVAGLLSGVARELPVEGPVFDPRPDPLARRLAYVRGRTLRLAELDGTSRELAGEEDPEISWGSAEFVAAEEMGRTRGYWWAPDGSAVVAARVDTTPVARWWISDPSQPDQPPVEHAYPAAGTANAHVTPVGPRARRAPPGDLVGPRRAALPGRRAVAGARADRADGAEPGPAPRRGAGGRSRHRPDDGPVRGQRRRVGRAGARRAGRAGRRPHRHDRGPRGRSSPRHVQHAPDPARAPGARHRGRHRPHAAVHGQPGRRRRRASGCGASATAPRRSRWSPRPACTAAGAAARRSWCARRRWRTSAAWCACSVVRSWSTTPRPRWSGPRSRCCEPGSGPSRPRSSSRTSRTAHRSPRDRCRSCSTPTAGPHAQRVVRARNGYTTSQWFADQGFAVVVADGRGTPGRGSEWERAVHLDLAGPVLDDQVEALQAAAEQHPLDLDRVAIRGWSFGGYLAALAVLRRPDVFHAAIAGAPVTDWRLYDTHYTERYLGTPAEQPEAYDRTSLVAEVGRAGDLPTRPLLHRPRPGRRQRRGGAQPPAVVGAPGRRATAPRAALVRRHPHDPAGGRGREPPPAAARLPAGVAGDQLLTATTSSISSTASSLVAASLRRGGPPRRPRPRAVAAPGGQEHEGEQGAEEHDPGRHEGGRAQTVDERRAGGVHDDLTTLRPGLLGDGEGRSDGAPRGPQRRGRNGHAGQGVGQPWAVDGGEDGAERRPRRACRPAPGWCR